MNEIKKAVEYFNNEEYEKAENIAIDVLRQNPENIDAIDVISAIFLKTNKSIVLEKGGHKNLDIIRRVARYLNELKMWPHSMAFYKKSLSIDPKDYVALNNLGLLYEEMLDDKNAKICYEKSIKLKYNFYALYNLGISYRKQKDTKNAIKYVEKALQLKPNDAQTEYSLGMLYFMESNFEKGYKYFLKRVTPGAELLKNLWDGSLQKDKTVLVYCDYGFGDAIMYARYFPLLKNYFKKVIVCCSPKLIELFKNSFEDIEYTTVYPEHIYDYSVLAMNLPYFLKMDFSQIPNSQGYLKADEKKVIEYKEKYFDTDKLKVGLFWIGGEREKRTAKNRFMALSDLQKIFELPEMKFYSLQVDDPFDDIQFYPDIVDLGKEFKDFSDTAAAMKNLDLMISIDSSAIHLAGAIGVKSFLMLPKCSEWRWFLDEKKTVWYDSVELFVQKELYDWNSVVDEIYEKLKQK